ncbi:MAG: hypothetical protein N2043_06025 [Ignavibacterium sp.]|nr:hypothetical protein [Ignavibacterium sp.]
MKNFLIVITLLFVINGCINYEQKTYIYPDGSGNMEIHYWMKATDSSSLAYLSNLNIFVSDSVKKEFQASFINNLEVISYSDSTDSTMNTKIKFEFTNIDSLNLIRSFSQYRFSLTDGASGQKVFSQFIPPLTSGFGFDSHNYKIKYVYTFHGDIIFHNATSEDKRQLIWEYNYSEIGNGKTISVTFKPFKIKETPIWIYILASIVFLVVVFYLFRKKRD